MRRETLPSWRSRAGADSDRMGLATFWGWSDQNRECEDEATIQSDLLELGANRNVLISEIEGSASAAMTTVRRRLATASCFQDRGCLPIASSTSLTRMQSCSSVTGCPTGAYAGTGRRWLHHSRPSVPTSDQADHTQASRSIQRGSGRCRHAASDADSRSHQVDGPTRIRSRCAALPAVGSCVPGGAEPACRVVRRRRRRSSAWIG